MGFVSPFLNKSESLPARARVSYSYSGVTCLRTALFLWRVCAGSVCRGWQAKGFQNPVPLSVTNHVGGPAQELSIPGSSPPFPFTQGQAAGRPRARATKHVRLNHLDCDLQCESRLSHICVKMCVSGQFHKGILTLRTWDALCFLFFHLKNAACSPLA